MAFGRKVPKGSLPVYSVADDEEASNLLVLACDTTATGQFFARELVQEQTLENLAAFSRRLAVAHDRLIETGRCRCKT